MTFARQVAVMMTGTAFAQVIPLAIAPLLTRLYSPEQFGALSALVAASSIIAIVASLRYELAIVLPKGEIVAINVAAIAVVCTACVVTLLFVGSLFPLKVAIAWGGASLHFEMVALLTFAIAVNQILNYSAVRGRGFRWIASSLIIQQFIGAIVAIVGGYLLVDNGLVLGRVIGLLCASAALLWALRSWVGSNVCSVRLDRSLEAARRYRQFPKFNVPYSFLGTFSREFLILSFTGLGFAAAAGQYGLARAVLVAPIGFLSSSLSQVFYREASKNLDDPSFQRLTVTLFVYVAAALTPIFVCVWLWSPRAFELVFGAGWREAGEYAAIIMPAVFLSLFTSWPERIFEAAGKQQYSLVVQLIFDSLSISAVLCGLWVEMPLRFVVGIYVTIQVLYHLTYLGVVLHLAQIGWKLYLAFLIILLLFISLSIVTLAPLMLLTEPNFLSMVGFGAFAALLSAVLVMLVFLSLKRVLPLLVRRSFFYNKKSA